MFNLNIHNVVAIDVSPVRELSNESSSMVYGTRVITFRTDDDTEFEVTVFSPYLSKDSDAELLQVRT